MTGQAMRHILFCVVLFSAAATAAAGTIDFENLPLANLADFCGGGGVNIGNFYANVGVQNIGADVFGLNAACGVSGFPANSGSINVFSEDDFATISFSAPVSSVSLFYVSLDTILLTAFDSGNNALVPPSIGSANTDGTTGTNSSLSVSAPNIAYVTLGNTGLADEYAFDDLSFTPQAQGVPEPSEAALTGLGLVAVWVTRRRSEA
jgi:hypothetical protein